VIDKQLGIQLDDQACIPGKAADGFVKVGVFNPDDALQVKLALELNNSGNLLIHMARMADSLDVRALL
jgi:hypothetical protein